LKTKEKEKKTKAVKTVKTDKKERILKELRSIVGEKNATADVDQFTVADAVVNTGPTKWRRRLRPAPMGRAYRQQRRYQHISITIKGQDAEEA